MNEYLPAFVIGYSDSSFTNPHEAALRVEPQECTGNFTHMGAKYWGFETARHRATRVDTDNQRFMFDDESFHWLQLGLKASSRVNKISISTRWFTGNQVQEVAVDLKSDGDWQQVIARTPLAPDQDHDFDIASFDTATQCRIRCYHEGGISRVSLFGEQQGGQESRQNLLDTAAVSHISNEHYGRPSDAVAGKRDIDYMFGWESARTGFGEYALFHLRTPATVREIIVDTYLHRLNPPLACHVFGLNVQETGAAEAIDAAWSVRPNFKLTFADGTVVIPEDFKSYMATKAYRDEPVSEPSRFSVSLHNPSPERWQPLISFGELHADTWHSFTDIETAQPVTHILYMHYPNGGIHGLRVYGD